ncbi:AraC family transcriptional regulator [Kibdelosporangium philippinense]|uniref:AraC family transcriptional regulator n=1 Tax=Kibdelosporangium philippinense TaxID=211113 RepID=A0ABS8ZKA6_9PSEU|nr:AraC family transcriptional regulator [Kibdelosporangium philippinense]MCE7008221.1 AraC family transcriptional regulator [Kibdelosporangium philippinense]
MKVLARYAALNSYVEVSQSVGVDPAGLMRGVGLDPASLGSPDRWVPAAAIARLLEQSAAASGHQDFGLKLAERRRLANLGPLSLVIREEPDLRSALRMLIRHANMYNEALRMRRSVTNGLTTVRIRFEFGEPVGARQATELAVGVLYRLLRDLLGPLWQPVTVCFTHPAPVDASTHRKFFGPMLKFEQEFDGIVFYASDLDTPNKLSDPQLRTYARQFLDSLGLAEETTPLDRVRELVELLLPSGRCSVEHVARSLGVDRRTVHRHLADANETFSSVLNSIRAELADQMVSSRRYSLTEIATLLSFSSSSNFSRWFRGQFGCTPSHWRAEKQHALPR